MCIVRVYAIHLYERDFFLFIVFAQLLESEKCFSLWPCTFANTLHERRKTHINMAQLYILFITTIVIIIEKIVCATIQRLWSTSHMM